MPNINWAKKLASEGSVSIPGGEKWGRAYDLALFEDFNDSQALVLLVTVILDFTFRDDDGGSWEDSEKAKFMNDVKAACEGAWSDRWLIKKGAPPPGLATGTSTTVPVRDLSGSASVARVVILIKAEEGMILPWSSHWTITARKVQSPVQNFVRGKSDVRFESTGLDPKVPYGGSKPRRSIVHEFGHLLGYRDEYPNSDRGTGAYLTDSDSIMHYGETVRERHYVFFADWMTNKLNSPWLVEGRRNLANTPL
jgi:hypothetical protein